MDGRPDKLKDCPIVLDSGCGTGESTRHIARRHPDAWVIGIDKSQHRLERTGSGAFPYHEGNITWIRAELATFWRLARDQGWELSHHYMLYPNPWPKPGQLQRRWHAHPVFSAMLALGGQLELRTNWSVYAREFAFSLEQVAGETAATIEMGVEAETPISSPFERKYRASGHRLFRVTSLLQRLPAG